LGDCSREKAQLKSYDAQSNRGEGGPEITCLRCHDSDFKRQSDQNGWKKHECSETQSEHHTT
jgi:hypothetical protein